MAFQFTNGESFVNIMNKILVLDSRGINLSSSYINGQILAPEVSKEKLLNPIDHKVSDLLSKLLEAQDDK